MTVPPMEFMGQIKEFFKGAKWKSPVETRGTDPVGDVADSPPESKARCQVTVQILTLMVASRICLWLCSKFQDGAFTNVSTKEGGS